ncbi:hypothetical protein AVEN_5064-1 [Araneus ventricosus]|uniref:Uncharacterized protein n=1 Tax=Araneus ventricosus TaxID=182803 RepID=A0A4Y2LCX9_ARAVE|nr:hypothetical protein AVEN_5064-1 [Araneus ventricosus]
MQMRCKLRYRDGAISDISVMANRSISNWTKMPRIDCSVGCMVTQEPQNILRVLWHEQDRIAPHLLRNPLFFLIQEKLPAQEVLWTVLGGLPDVFPICNRKQLSLKCLF